MILYILTEIIKTVIQLMSVPPENSLRTVYGGYNELQKGSIKRQKS